MARPALLGGTPVTSAAGWPRWPQWDDREATALREVLESGGWQAGPRVAVFERSFAGYQGATHAICVTNGTTSLELALRALGIGPGDEVIVPSYTFAATALAVMTVGAIPVFVDCEPEHLNIDPGAVDAAIGPLTRAIVPVHVGGHPVDLDAVMALAQAHGLFVVEDAAHAHGAEWQGKRIGAHGHCASFSFQTGKSITSGDGGCLTTSHADVAEELRSLRDFGRDESGSIVRVGGNYRMTEFQAALLSCALARLDGQIERRQENVAALREGLRGVPGLRVAETDPRVTRHPFYQTMIHVDTEAFGLDKATLLRALQAEGVPLEGGYQPLHRMPLFERAVRSGAARALACPVTDGASDSGVLWLSFRMAMAEPEQLGTVTQALAKIQAFASELRAAAPQSR